jgi:hypothetical protein
MTMAGLVCACEARPREGDKFCHECGASVVGKSAKPADYQQVTYRRGGEG